MLGCVVWLLWMEFVDGVSGSWGMVILGVDMEPESPQHL